MADKCAWLKRNADALRQTLLFEPRGHADMTGALLTEPVTAGADAGLVFLDNAGYDGYSGDAIIAATTIALERRLVVTAGEGSSLTYDTVTGAVRVRVSSELGDDVSDSPRVVVKEVSLVNVPSFVLEGGLTVKLDQRPLRVDVAFGGMFYAIVDSEGAGLRLDGAHVPELRRAGRAIKQAVEATHTIAHPVSGPAAIGGVTFTAPPDDERASLQSATVFADGQVARSPNVAATAALMAVLDAMGLMSPDVPFTNGSLIGTRLSGKITGRTAVGEYDAIVPEITGSAWVTGEHTFLVDHSDPVRNGYRLG
jgi:proline racemase